jgi:hypothetical protein
MLDRATCSVLAAISSFAASALSRDRVPLQSPAQIFLAFSSSVSSSPVSSRCVLRQSSSSSVLPSLPPVFVRAVIQGSGFGFCLLFVMVAGFVIKLSFLRLEFFEFLIVFLW